MYYRIESNSNEINIVLDTKLRNNNLRNPLFTPLFKHMMMIAHVSLSNNLTITDTLKHIEQNHLLLDADMNMVISNIFSIYDTIYEMEKPSDINIKRTDCAFFFDSIANCKTYRNYPGMSSSSLCKIEIIEKYDEFRGDMNWLEKIDSKTVKAHDIKLAAQHYWAGDMTSNPIPEILFLGKYKLIKI